MSRLLQALATRFANDEMTGEEFASRYIELWKEERDAGLLTQDPDELSERLSTIFCLADLFSPSAQREVYEFDEPQLRREVRNILQLGEIA